MEGLVLIRGPGPFTRVLICYSVSVRGDQGPGWGQRCPCTPRTCFLEGVNCTVSPQALGGVELVLVVDAEGCVSVCVRHVSMYTCVWLVYMCTGPQTHTVEARDASRPPAGFRTMHLVQSSDQPRAQGPMGAMEVPDGCMGQSCQPSCALKAGPGVRVGGRWDGGDHSRVKCLGLGSR